MNARAKLEAFPPVKRLEELELTKVYTIKVLRHVKTKYGDKVVVECIEDEETFTAFLPKRISEDILSDPNSLSELVAEATQGDLFMKYLGGKYHNMEFIENNN